MKKLLFISYYRDKHPTRQNELEHCLIKNIENPEIDHIFIMLEGMISDFPVFHNKIPKITVWEDCQRPTYQTLFNAANAIMGDQEIITIFANTDIYFDETLKRLEDIRPNMCFALSRWDVAPDGSTKLHNEQYSQDVWIFRGKIRTLRVADFCLGIPGCDNRIAYEIFKAGYTILNPSKTIKSYHYHASDLHTYDGTYRIDKPFLPVPLIEI